MMTPDELRKGAEVWSHEHLVEKALAAADAWEKLEKALAVFYTGSGGHNLTATDAEEFHKAILGAITRGHAALAGEEKPQLCVDLEVGLWDSEEIDEEEE